MRRFIAVIVMVTMLFPSFVFAQDDITIGIDNKNNITATGGNAASDQDQNQNQTQSEWQKQKQEMQSIITTPGNMPVASTHAIGQTANQTGDYGKLISASSFQNTAAFFCGTSGAEFQVMTDVMDSDGVASWEAINKKIIPHPFIHKKFPILNDNERVYFPKGKMALALLKTTRRHQVLGGYFYDSKFDKNNSVLKPHLQMRARQDAAKLGANVVIDVEEFDQRYFVPENFEFSVAGVISWISKMFTRGGSVAGSAGMAVGQNTAFARPGAAFIFLHIQGVDEEICYDLIPPPVVIEKNPPPAPPAPTCNPESYIRKIRESEKRIAKCWRYGHSNMVDRRNAARENLNAWICTKQTKYLREAIEHYQMAELNYIHGWDIKKYSDSDDIIAEVEYGLASAFYARDRHIENFWKAPKVVVHENKKSGKDKPVPTTAYEKREILKIRHTLEKYSQELTLN